MARIDGTESPSRERISEKDRKRTWPVVAVGLLLLLQAIGLLALSAVHFGAAYLVQAGLLEQLLEQSAEEQLLNLLPTPVKMWAIASLGTVNEELLSRMTETTFVSISLLFIVLSAMAILAAISFLRTEQNAWTAAMLVQGLNLLMALILYFRGKPWYVYVMMLYSIPIVLYLNYHEVRVVFQFRPTDPQQARRARIGGHKGGDR
jgi:hypothetical protein